MISPYVFPGLIDLKKESRKIRIERGLKYANTIIRSICFDRNITKTEISSKSRLKEICEARQLSIYFIRKNTELPLKEIGKLFNRDHATVMHSIQSIENQLSYNKKIGLEINRLKLLF
jgi:chromosomal replication initiator protein